VLSGHATQALPQVVLELDGDAIRAVGIQGLIFGDEAAHG
jgi:Rieske Fe-S protein